MSQPWPNPSQQPPPQPQPTKRAWWKTPKVLVGVVCLIVAGFFLVKSLTADPLKEFKEHDCVTGGSKPRGVDCDDPDAVYKLGGSCEYLLEISKGGKSDTFCADKLDD